MGTDVDFEKIKLNFSSVFEQLNTTAKDFAEKKGGGSIVVDYGTFDAGGGNVGVAVYLMMKDDTPLADKSKFVDVAKEYIKFSVGEDQVASVSEDKLLAITQADHAEGAGDHTTSESTSYYTGEERTLLRVLFEADDEKSETPQASDAQVEKGASAEKPTDTPSDSADSSKEGEADKKPENSDGDDAQKDGEDSPDNQVRGYAFTYWLTVSGKSEFLNKVKSKSKGLFSGMFADLQNLQLNWKDGTSTKIGQILNPDKWKEALGVQAIDKDKLVSKVVEQFERDFSGTNISTHDVSVDQRKDILTKLNRYKRLTPKLAGEIKGKIPEDVFSVVIQVGDEDVKFSDYNEASVAKTMTKAFGTSGNLVDFNSVSEKDVIRVANVQGDKDRNNDDGSSSVSEAEAKGGDADKKNTDDKKPDKKPDKKRQEIDKHITTTLGARVKEAFKRGYNNSLSCGLDDLETYIKAHPILKGERSVDQLKDRSSHVLYIQYRKPFTLSESMVGDGIIAKIFEADPDTGGKGKTAKDKFFEEFTKLAEKALQDTAKEAIDKFKMNTAKPDLDVVTVQKAVKDTPTVKESCVCVSNIIHVLFEENGNDSGLGGETGETGKGSDKDSVKDTEKPTKKKKKKKKKRGAQTPFWFFALLSDPTRPNAKNKGGTGGKSPLGDRVDWYIIPNKRIKNIDKSDKNEQNEV